MFIFTSWSGYQNSLNDNLNKTTLFHEYFCWLFFLLFENISLVHLLLTENNSIPSKPFCVLETPSIASFAGPGPGAGFAYAVYGSPHPSIHHHPSNCSTGQISFETSGPLDYSICCNILPPWFCGHINVKHLTENSRNKIPCIWKP